MLTGWLIINTRPLAQAQQLTAMLRNAGAVVVEFPMLEIVFEDVATVDRSPFEGLDSTDWLVFASANAVRGLVRLMQASTTVRNAVERTNHAVIGAATAREMQRRGLGVHFCSPVASAVELAHSFISHLKQLDPPPNPRTVLILRGEPAVADLPFLLQAANNVSVRELVLYQSICPPGAADAVKGIDAAMNHATDKAKARVGIILTSCAAVENLIFLLPEDLRGKFQRIPCFALGPQTAACAQAAGFREVYSSDEQSDQGLVESIRKVGSQSDAV